MSTSVNTTNRNSSQGDPSPTQSLDSLRTPDYARFDSSPSEATNNRVFQADLSKLNSSSPPNDPDELNRLSTKLQSITKGLSAIRNNPQFLPQYKSGLRELSQLFVTKLPAEEIIKPFIVELESGQTPELVATILNHNVPESMRASLADQLIELLPKIPEPSRRGQIGTLVNQLVSGRLESYYSKDIAKRLLDNTSSCLQTAEELVACNDEVKLQARKSIPALVQALSKFTGDTHLQESLIGAIKKLSPAEESARETLLEALSKSEIDAESCATIVSAMPSKAESSELYYYIECLQREFGQGDDKTGALTKAIGERFKLFSQKALAEHLEKANILMSPNYAVNALNCLRVCFTQPCSSPELISVIGSCFAKHTQAEVSLQAEALLSNTEAEISGKYYLQALKHRNRNVISRAVCWLAAAQNIAVPCEHYADMLKLMSEEWTVVTRDRGLVSSPSLADQLAVVLDSQSPTPHDSPSRNQKLQEIALNEETPERVVNLALKLNGAVNTAIPKVNECFLACENNRQKLKLARCLGMQGNDGARYLLQALSPELSSHTRRAALQGIAAGWKQFNGETLAQAQSSIRAILSDPADDLLLLSDCLTLLERRVLTSSDYLLELCILSSSPHLGNRAKRILDNISSFSSQEVSRLASVLAEKPSEEVLLQVVAILLKTPVENISDYAIPTICTYLTHQTRAFRIFERILQNDEKRTVLLKEIESAITNPQTEEGARVALLSFIAIKAGSGDFILEVWKPVLATLLKDQNPTIGEAAAKALGALSLARASVPEELSDVLKSSSALNVKITAADYILRNKPDDPEAIKTLEDVLLQPKGDLTWTLREEALDVLSLRWQDKVKLAEVIALSLPNYGPKVRRKAFSILASLRLDFPSAFGKGEVEARRAISETLQAAKEPESEDEPTAAEALVLLGNMGHKAKGYLPLIASAYAYVERKIPVDLENATERICRDIAKQATTSGSIDRNDGFIKDALVDSELQAKNPIIRYAVAKILLESNWDIPKALLILRHCFTEQNDSQACLFALITIAKNTKRLLSLYIQHRAQVNELLSFIPEIIGDRTKPLLERIAAVQVLKTLGQKELHRLGDEERLLEALKEALGASDEYTEEEDDYYLATRLSVKAAQAMGDIGQRAEGSAFEPLLKLLSNEKLPERALIYAVAISKITSSESIHAASAIADYIRNNELKGHDLAETRRKFLRLLLGKGNIGTEKLIEILNTKSEEDAKIIVRDISDLAREDKQFIQVLKNLAGDAKLKSGLKKNASGQLIRLFAHTVE